MSFSSFSPFNVMILDLDRNSQSLSIQARSSKASPSLPFSALPRLLSLSEPLRSHQPGSFPLKGFCRSYLSVCKLHPSTPSFCPEVSAHCSFFRSLTSYFLREAVPAFQTKTSPCIFPWQSITIYGELLSVFYYCLTTVKHEPREEWLCLV